MSIADSLSNLRKVSKYDRILFLVLAAAFFLRFFQLGYSHFYGDETKTFYLDKTVPAHKFFLDQRKGPVQFGVVWVTEKIFLGFDEFYTRLPFAWAGFLSVLVFFLLVQKFFDKRVALIATTLFSLNGLFIAFSRTVQYQSFLILFGLLAVYFSHEYYFTKTKNDKHYAFLSALFLGLAFLSHYDAIFYSIPVFFMIIKKLLEEKNKLKQTLSFFVLPTVAIIGTFYIPYYLYGFFNSNTVNYVGNRLLGIDLANNVSWYTFWVYNPTIVWAIFIIFSFIYFFKQADWKRNLIILWFIFTFVTFEYVFSNPGTHILNYLIPLIVMVSLGISDLYNGLNKVFYRNLYSFIISILFLFILYVDLRVYIPMLSQGFPWKNSGVNNELQLYLYGFPYYRGWDEIADYVDKRGMVHKIYTNDNDTVAQYYLHGISYTRPGTNYLPDFYIHVEDNQELTEFKKYMDPKDLDYYILEKEFFVNGTKTASFYRLKK